jgi:DNA (cytosine-5)-methyltransferase 1
MRKDKKYKGVYIDLFSGCGGLSLGLGNAGWKGLFAIEKDPMAFETFRHNLIDGKYAHFDWPAWLPKQETTIQTLLKNYSKELKKLRGSVDLIAGGPPCQGFSLAGQRKSNDPRNKLSYEYIRVVDLVRPKYIVLENVSGFNAVFTKQEGRASRVPYAVIVKERLEGLGYKVFHDYIKCEQYGVPQERKRFLMVGVRKDVLSDNSSSPFDVLSGMRERFLKSKKLPMRPITVKEAICDLETTAKGAQIIEHSKISGRIFKKLDYKAPRNKGPYLSLMRNRLNSVQPNSMRLATHKQETIKKFELIKKVSRPGVVLNKEEKGVLNIKKQAICVLHPNKPSKTLTTLPDDLLHYKEPRILTVRESARIQSFPDDFEFKGKYTTGGKVRTKECPRYSQVGNAVPPLLGEVIGCLIFNLCEGH